ncbi:hypothetical protein [Luteimicrobium album]|nr:hypothetical protein [Luteimicrobium album]
MGSPPQAADGDAGFADGATVTIDERNVTVGEGETTAERVGAGTW